MTAKQKLIVGTRGSLLAMTQTQWVIDRLQEAVPGLEAERRVIKTTGDMDQKTRLDRFAGLGVFVKELRTAMLAGQADCAVHSLKDVPEGSPEGLMLAAFPEREDARDAFISNGPAFMKMAPGARIGTGSPRRLMQLRAQRPDLEYAPIRGNLDTRIRKVREGGLDGAVVAAAGLRRLGRADEMNHTFSLDMMIPAVGQGALALECRAGDKRVARILRSINHGLTEAAIRVEREFMRRVGGGCKVPMACHVYLTGGGFRLMAAMGDADTGRMGRVERNAGPDELEALVEEAVWNIMEECKDKGIKTKDA